MNNEVDNANLMSELDGYGSNDAWTQPIDSETALNAKIISSDNKDKKIVISKPVYEKNWVSIALLDSDGKPFLDQDGRIIIKAVKKVHVFKGFEQEEIPFPLPDWFNDSIPSSFLTPREGRFIRFTDYLAFSLFVEMLENPDANDKTKMIALLGWVKASFADSSKGIEGEGVKYSKSTFSRQENINRNYGDSELLEAAKLAKKKKGFLWSGIGPDFP